MKITWKPTGKDQNDLIARIEKDILRVEQMDAKTFWWCCYIGDDTYDCWNSPKPRPKSIEEAKKQCEEKYIEIVNKKK